MRFHTLFMDGTSMKIHMLVEKKYPLMKELLKKMLNLQLEAEEESTMAFELIKFFKLMLEEGGLLGILSYYCQYYFTTAGSRLILLLKIEEYKLSHKGKKLPLLSTSSSSSLSDDNEAPSFLEFYDELSDNEDLTKAQREKRGMFKCLNCYAGTITNSGHLCWKMRPTDPPYGRSVRCFGGSVAHQSRRQNSNFLDF
ncbi:hypothetical protein Tco_1187597 [Tanacetum coccineum]